MSITATFSSKSTSAVTRHEDVESGWKTVDLSAQGFQEYAPIAKLQCGDLASFPIFLSTEQSESLENILRNKLSGPRGPVRLLDIEE